MTAKEYLIGRKILALEMFENELFNILSPGESRAIKRDQPVPGGVKLSRVKEFTISGDLLTVRDIVFDLSLIEVDLSRKEFEKEKGSKEEEEELMKKLNRIISIK